MLKCQKFSQPAGDSPRNPPTGTLPPSLNALGVDTYVRECVQSPKVVHIVV